MRTIFFVLLLFYALQVKADPLNSRLDYLDPILFQEHVQSPNGRYKYGYESNSAIAQQVHDPDGTAKGFYSYVDDQGKVQKVEYVAGHDGFKVLGSNAMPVYTAEVEAARQAHMEAYLAVQKRILEEQRAAALKSSSVAQEIRNKGLALEDAVKVQEKLFLEAQQKNYNNIFKDFALQQKLFEEINLFATGKTAYSSLRRNEATTTPRPFDQQVESKNYILPLPTVDHYEKVWPLPPLKFKDLAIEVNGQDRYDPKVQYNHWYNNRNPNTVSNFVPVASTKQPIIVTEPVPQIGANILNTVSNFNTFVPIASTKQPIVTKPDVQATPQFDTSGLTAHQAELLRYKQSISIDPPILNLDFFDKTTNQKSRGNFVVVDDPVTKIVVAKSHVETKQSDIVEKAFENALNSFRTKYVTI